MTFRVALINMPFGAVHTPSLGLTQLKAVLARELDAAVRAEILYLNHDFAQFFGVNLYRYLSDDSRTTVTGFTDWLFRPIAFPEAVDTTSQYLARYSYSLACRCEDGRRREIDGCAAAPSACSTSASEVPCCLEPDLLGDVLRKRARLAEYVDDLIDRYRLAEYHLVGFTSMFDQTVASIAMARRLKSRDPRVTTVMGGASCEPGVGRVVAKRVDAIDFVFAGPALRSFPEFVGSLVRNEPEQCHRIRGVYSHANVQQPIPGSDAALGDEDDINHRLPLDYGDFLSSVRSKCSSIIPELFFETSRGCWWGERAHCTFCGINGATMTFRVMSPENAIAQFTELFDAYPTIQRFVAVDNILDPSYYSSVFPFAKAPEGASIFYETRVITKDEHIRLLAQAGITRIQPGIESLSTRILSLMKKGSTAFHNLAFLKKIFTYGIEVEWNLLTGFPNEDSEVYEEYLKIIPLIVHLPAPVATFPVRFDRHSPYHKNPAAFGLDLKPVDFYSLVYPFADDELEQLAYFWADHNFSNSYLFNVARWQRKIETAVDGWRARWYQRDGKLRPEVKFADDGRAVYDSRSGDAVEHPLSPLGREMLRHMDSPMRRRDLARAVGAGEEQVDVELAALNGYGLLFTEGDHVLSLVTSGVPMAVHNARHAPSLVATHAGEAKLLQLIVRTPQTSPTSESREAKVL
ncbi:MAG TPA: RiPP maturation radical SAM C-methyltransferase [Vicinamibacterales bacterium]|nr:RiPP maturation radical SAM C-methyltransferase [Vicinamibacterales bacterium]